ncbi:MAG: prolipoprotein diacylglyceryl transferase [Phycisphaerae bacterium]|nr:prolipoprotein diacylglyceryl transferase [Phycisphaerae bacterium]
MMPVVFKVPGLGLEVPGYGLMLMIGFLLSIWWAARRAERSGANPDVVLNCGFLALLCGVVGARFMYVVHYWDQFSGGNLLQIILKIIDVRRGGLEVYGGFILVVASVLVYLWWGRHSIRWYFDIVAPSAALGMAIGRLGCFLNGCCWGGVCDLPWAVRFPYGSGAQVQQWSDREPGAGLPQELMVFPQHGLYADGSSAYAVTRESLRATDAELADVAQRLKVATDQANELKARLDRATDAREKAQIQAEMQKLDIGSLRYGDLRTQMKRYNLTAAELRDLAKQHRSLPVHPTQLYSFITLGLLAALLSALYWRRTRDGQVICTLLLIEPWTRWILETLRADNPVDTLGGFTISQFLAICLSAVGLLGLLLLQRQPPRSPRAQRWEPPDSPAPATKKAGGARAAGQA